LGQQADRVTQVSRGNRDINPKSGNSSRVNRVGNKEQKTGGSSWIVNMESRATKNLVNTESRVMENSVNMENRVMQDSGGKKSKEGKGDAPSKRPAPRWCPRGITKTQKHRLQKMRQRWLAEKKEEEERDYSFNHLRPMTKLKQTWWEK
jgi:hypothetical protein